MLVEEDASFERRTGNSDLENTNTGTGKSGLTSEVAHELLSPEPQQAMGPQETGQENKSFSSEAWNSEISPMNPKSVPAPAWVLPTGLQLPGAALPSRYLCATEQLHFPPSKISYNHGSPFMQLRPICSYSVEELSLNQSTKADKISVKNSLTLAVGWENLGPPCTISERQCPGEQPQVIK